MSDSALIYAEVSNLKEIKYPGIKQGFFRNIFFETNGREKWI